VTKHGAKRPVKANELFNQCFPRFKLLEGEWLLTINYNDAFNGKQEMLAYVNGELAKVATISGPGRFEIFLTPDADGMCKVVLKFPDAVSPKSIGSSEDGRVLALGIGSIVIEPIR